MEENLHGMFAGRGWNLAMALVAGLSIVPLGAHAADGVATGDTSGKKIALSNSYAGNSFRQVMVRSWEEVAAQAQKDHLIAGSTVVSANNSVTQQAADIENMILQGYNAIAIVAASDTALNGAIHDACAAGVVVVAFNGRVTEDCAYSVNYDFESMGRAEVEYVAQRLKDKGNLLEIRGIAGDATDADISKGIHDGVAKASGLQLQGTVYGQWTATVAQKEVAGILPSLPPIDAIVTQGGDGYGAAMSFQAAGRPLPIIIMGARQDELTLWQAQHKANGYETMSISATPSSSQIAFWVAQQILAGKQVPKKVEIPLLRIEQKDLDAWIPKVPEGGVANPFYTRELTAAIIDANAHHAPLPAIPAPKL